MENNNNSFEKNIRPITFDDYIGQSEVKENIKIFVKAALMRNETLDHTLLYGPPGLGKTTLAYIIASEMSADIKTVSGPSIEKAGDLASVLSSLEKGDILFIDEIHRLPKFVEELLYSAMEDYSLDIIIGSEGQTRSIKIDLPPFTLIGATTKAGNLSSPLRDRFGITCKLNYYTDQELKDIVKRTSKVMGINISDESALEVAKRSKKTPRIANKLLKRISDYALVEGKTDINIKIVLSSFDKLKVDSKGLEEVSTDYLMSIINKFNGGPVGIDAISSSIGEETSTIEDLIEPYLLQEGYIKRTSRGRIVTDRTYKYFKLK
ncbi:MAG: Holliday junction branch migration DNA helicase RuvB [Bacilli bacterium]